MNITQYCKRIYNDTRPQLQSYYKKLPPFILPKPSSTSYVVFVLWVASDGFNNINVFIP